MTSLPSHTLETIELVAELIRKARHTVVATGAGFSTPFGIYHFRPEGSGLWLCDESLEADSPMALRTHPDLNLRAGISLFGDVPELILGRILHG
jgi:NAD-dependent SIR2 family protein deacetylase